MPLEIGSLIGPYRIVEWLGAGGMGDVYRAHDARLDRDVAIKLIAEPFAADARRVQRFEQEARVAGQLNHPNVLTVYDVGSHAGTPFIIAELLEGESLRARLARAALPPAKAIDYARQAAHGLAAAHDKGVVHRDIKPENLFITSDDRIKILDFGIAKLTPLDEDDRAGARFETITELGVVLGTRAYMSPEQVRGERVDARSDIFGVGTVLHEMLSGRPPFARKTAAETTAAILKEEPPPLPGATSETLTAVVARCLEKSRENRFQSARDLAFALDTLPASTTLAHAPVVPRRKQPPVVAIGLILAIAIAAALWLTRRDVPTPESLFANARFTRLTNWEGTEGHGEVSPDGRFVAFLADSAGQFDVWLSQPGTGRFENLTSGTAKLRAPGMLLRTLGFSGDGSEIWSDAGLMPLMGGPARKFLPPESAGASWSPDGTRLAFFRNIPTDPLFIADRTGGDARSIFSGEEAGVHTHNPAWSPDGAWIYFLHGRAAPSFLALDVWRVRPSGESPEQLTHRGIAMNSLAPLDSETLLYTARAEDQSGPWLWVLDIPSRVSRKVVLGPDQYRSVSASRDGKRIVASVANPTTTLVRVPILDRIAGAGDVKPFAPAAASARAPRFGPGSMFYLSPRGANDGLWQLKDGKVDEVWNGDDASVMGPAAVSPDGGRVAAVLWRDGKPRVMVMSTDGTDARSLAMSVEAEGAIDWSPDGAWIVAGGSDAQGAALFKIPLDGGAPVRLVEGQATNPVWSPDGNLIVYAGPFGGMSSLRGVRPDGEAVELPPVQVRPGGQRFMPDGSGVVYQSAELDFWVLELSTGRQRQLTDFNAAAALMSARMFDITPDGKEIVFDRLRENLDIVLIELPQSP